MKILFAGIIVQIVTDHSRIQLLKFIIWVFLFFHSLALYYIGILNIYYL